MTDLENEKMAARWSDDGIYGTPADTAVVTAGTGHSVDIAADVYGSVRGHAWTSGTTGDTLAVSANASGSTRIDRVVLRLDRSTWTVRAVVKEGTPGAGAPALSQSTGDTGTYEISLALVSVLSGAGSVTVTRGELYVGSRVRPCTSTTRNPNPVPGEQAYETNTGILRVWDGSAWRSVYEVSGTTNVDSPLSAWDMVASSAYDRDGRSVTLRAGTFERKGSNLAAGTDSRLPVLMPASAVHPFLQHQFPVYLTGARIGNVTVYPANHARAGQVWLTQHPGVNAGQNINSVTMNWTV
ncbi:hypothetical protein [Streptomyces sp. DH20]|uniref:hypothetical protein n=1 Tax=Streptomyces sp. DH20 TaxID=2857009 RepID=UPI001E4348B0|nr:hypothetical protein [Streptomyces sp. DH20]